MKFRDLAYETSSALLANRARSLLTILGIVIGIASVIAMTALIDGVKAQLVGQLGLNMSRTVSITCWPPGNQPLDQGDIEEMGQALAGDYEFVTGYTYAGGPASSSTAEVEYLNITACEPAYFQGMGLAATQGRLFTEEEEEDGAMVVVLGGSSVQNLFGSPDADCVGKTVRIGSSQYTVVGAIKTDTPYQSDIAYMPASTAVTRLIGQGGYSSWQILGFAREGSDMYTVAANTESYLYQRYDIPYPEEGQTSFSSDEGYVYVQTAQALIDQLDATTATFRMLALAVASISLLVGGIGIMNMMLTSVTERTTEIGLKKALGAIPWQIQVQFLIESFLLSIIGGIAGVALGLLLSIILTNVMGTEFVVSVGAIVLGVGFSAAVGIIFGWAPARKASKLNPIDALRSM